jgi:HSP20 family protein
MFDEWVQLMPVPVQGFPHWWEAGDLIRVEEYREDGTLVIHADLPGIDPEKDVELTASTTKP